MATPTFGQGLGTLGILIPYWWECKMVALEDNLVVSYKNKLILLPHSTAMMILSIYSRVEILMPTQNLTQIFLAALFNCQIQNK